MILLVCAHIFQNSVMQTAKLHWKHDKKSGLNWTILNFSLKCMLYLSKQYRDRNSLANSHENTCPDSFFSMKTVRIPTNEEKIYIFAFMCSNCLYKILFCLWAPKMWFLSIYCMGRCTLLEAFWVFDVILCKFTHLSDFATNVAFNKKNISLKESTKKNIWCLFYTSKLFKCSKIWFLLKLKLRNPPFKWKRCWN